MWTKWRGCPSSAGPTTCSQISARQRNWLCTEDIQNTNGLMVPQWREYTPRKTYHELFQFQYKCRQFYVFSAIQKSFYNATLQCNLTRDITTWYEKCCADDCKVLQRVERADEWITRSVLPSLQDIYTRLCRPRAANIFKDPTHPNNRLLLCSGKHLNNIFFCGKRILQFAHRQTVVLL